MKIFDCLASAGRAFDFAKTYPGLSECRVSGQHFYATVPGTGGRRDLSKLGPDEAQAWLNEAPDAPHVFDIEARRASLDATPRPLAADLYGNADVPAFLDDTDFLKKALELVGHADAPPIGLYDVIPSGLDVYNIVLLNSERRKILRRKMNDFIADTGLVDLIDCFFPSLYASYNTPDLWAGTAKFQFAECRRLASRAKRSLPIIPFLCPTYHPSGGELANKPIGLDFWKFQLVTLRKARVYGAVLWHSGGDWNEIEPYAKAAQECAA